MKKSENAWIVALLTVFLFLSIIGSSVPPGASASDKVSLTVTRFSPRLDAYGLPAVNPDGSFYPGDCFEIGYSVTVASDVNFLGVSAIFDEESFELSAGPGWRQVNGTGYFNITRTAAPGNYTVTLEAKAERVFDRGYQPTGWITVTSGGVRVDGYYIAQNLLTVSVNNQSMGTTDPSPGSYWYNSGSVAQVSASAYSGYVFDYWLLDGANASSNNPIAVVMDSPHALQAVFAPATTMSLGECTGGAAPGGEPQSEPAGDPPGTFVVHGVSSDCSSWIVEVDGVKMGYGAFPITLNFDVGSAHSYAWNEMLSSSLVGRRYLFQRVTETFYYSDSKGVAVKIVAYDPQFLVLPYLIANETHRTQYERALAIMVVYLGNGPNRNLDQRAVLESFSWGGIAAKMASSEDLRKLIEKYINTTDSIFGEVGLDGSVKDTVVTIDGKGYGYGDLPKSFSWANGTTHTFEWAERLAIYSNGAKADGEWFEWSGAAGSSADRTGTAAVGPEGFKMVANYARVKTLSSFASDVGLNASDAYSCYFSLPVYFNKSQTFKKFVIKVNDVVVRKVYEDGYEPMITNNLFYTSMFCPSPRAFVDVSFVYSREDYKRKVELTAFKWSPSATTRQTVLLCNDVFNYQWSTSGSEPYLTYSDDNYLYTSTPGNSFLAAFQALPTDAAKVSSAVLHIVWKPHQDWWTTDVSNASLYLWTPSDNQWHYVCYWGGKVPPWDPNPWQDSQVDITWAIKSVDDLNKLKIAVTNLHSRVFRITQFYIVVKYLTGQWVVDDSVKMEASFTPASNATSIENLLKKYFKNVMDVDRIVAEILEDFKGAEVQSFSGVGSFSCAVSSLGSFLTNATITAGHIGPSGAWAGPTATVSRTVCFNFLSSDPCRIYVNLDENSPLDVEVHTDSMFKSDLNFNFPAQLGGVKRLTFYVMSSYPSGPPSTWPDSAITEVYSEDTPPPTSATVEFYQFCGEYAVSITKDQRFTALEGYKKCFVLVEVENIWGTKFYKVLQVEPFTVFGTFQVDWSLVLFYLFIAAFNLISAGLYFDWARFEITGESWLTERFRQTTWRQTLMGRGRLSWLEFASLVLPHVITIMVDIMNKEIYYWIFGHYPNVPEFIIIGNIFVMIGWVFVLMLALYFIIFFARLVSQE